MFKIKKFQKEVADFLEIEIYKIKFEDLGEDTPYKLLLHDNYLAINKKLKKDEIKLMEIICVEYRKLYQMKERLAHAKGKFKDTSYEYRAWVSDNRIEKELSYSESKLDCDAFTRYYLQRFKGIELKYDFNQYAKNLDIFIDKNINRFELDRIRKEKEAIKAKDL